MLFIGVVQLPSCFFALQLKVVTQGVKGQGLLNIEVLQLSHLQCPQGASAQMCARIMTNAQGTQ